MPNAVIENAYPDVPEHGPVIVTRDGRPIHVRMDTPNEAFAFLLRWQGQSVAYALTEGGYQIVQVPADRWSDVEAHHLSYTAFSVFRHDHAQTIYPKSERELVRANCGACALEGYDSTISDGPNYAGWARAYVEARRPIPSRWRGAFERELESDNEAYAAALKLSVATFGVSWKGVN